MSRPVTWDQLVNYLLLAYHDKESWAALSPDERELIEAACSDYLAEMRQRGYLFAVEDLQNDQTALTVKVVNGELLLTEGVSAEYKKQLAQLIFIKARDLNEAVQVVSKMPQSRLGPIEVRTITKLEQL